MTLQYAGICEKLKRCSTFYIKMTIVAQDSVKCLANNVRLDSGYIHRILQRLITIAVYNEQEFLI